MIETQLAGKFKSVSYTHAHGNCYEEYGNNFQDQHNSLLVFDARWGRGRLHFPSAFRKPDTHSFFPRVLLFFTGPTPVRQIESNFAERV
jgi:hypothetical protein